MARGENPVGTARALVILEADTEAEAVSFATRDPIVVNGVAEVEVHPWQLMLQRDGGK